MQSRLEETLNCLQLKYQQSDEKLNAVVSRITHQHAKDTLLLDSFEKAQTQWQEGIKTDCNSVYDFWRYGSVKNIKWFDCKITLTKQRIQFLNRFYNE